MWSIYHQLKKTLGSDPIIWNIPNIRGRKSKLKELIKIPFICKWYYDFYYLHEKEIKDQII